MTTPRLQRRANPAWIGAGLLAGVVGLALLVVDRAPQHLANQNLAVLHDDAGKLAETVDSAIRGAQARVDGLAQAPMLRAAVETDAPHVRDMFDGDLKVQLDPGETLELLQHQGSAATMLIRVPDGPPLAGLPDHGARVRVTSNRLEVVVTAPVTTQRGEPGGAIALEVPVDVTELKRQLATRATSASLVGLDAPLVLVDGDSRIGTSADIPVAFAGAGTATLAATLPPLPIPPPSILLWVRLACWTLGGLLLVGYVVVALRARR